MGRRKAVIDWKRVGEMFEAECTVVGVAATLGIDQDTLYKRCKTDLNTDLSVFRQQKKAKGDEMLREIQLKTAKAGYVTMQIWLGKQRLGQSDKSEVSQTIRKIEVHWLDGDRVPNNDSDTISDSIN
jgi:hypothetical protein